MTAPVARRPRLLIVITRAQTGGAGTYIVQLLPALVQRFEVAVAANGRGPLRDATAAAGVRFIELRYMRRAINPGYDLLGLIELIGVCRRERPDIVHTNSSKAGLLGRLSAWLTGVPIRIFTAHGWAFSARSGPASWLYRCAEWIMRWFTTLVICVSENEMREGLRAGACSASRAVVIRNAIDADSFEHACRGTGPPRLVSVGRLQAPKDFVTLLRGLARLEPASFRAAIVGDGPDRPSLEAELRRLDLEAAVELLGERDDVPDILAKADVFVLSTTSEGLPMTVLEAMAARLPVVASSVGGLPELVVDGQTGLLVPAANPVALATCLERLIADESLRRRLGEAGRSRAERLFDIGSFRSAHIDVYRRELERRGLPLPA